MSISKDLPDNGDSIDLEPARLDDGTEDDLPPADPVEAAEAAGLYYVMEGEPGFSRRLEDGQFIYLDLKGQPVASARQQARMKSLVIPPAWSDVWICCRPNGHIQATGRDKKGRKQYRYHPDWSAIRSLSKFYRSAAFGEALPGIRAQVEQDLRGIKLSHPKVVALVIRLLDRTLIRIGNQEYTRMNNSYGLTTLLDEHITVEGSRLQMRFTGKRGKQFDIDLRDRRLTNLIKRCQDLPGQRLFQYLDENGQCCQTITSGDVNSYLRQVTGQDFTAKDFRTWGGTTLAAVELYQRGPAEDEKQAEKQVVQVVKSVAEMLGNTPAVCRAYYIHPAVLAAYRDGSLFQIMAGVLHRAGEPQETGLTVDEQAVLHLLKTQASSGGVG